MRFEAFHAGVVLADVCQIAGVALVVLGVADVYRPAAFMVAGAYLILFSFGLAERRST